MKHPAWRNGAWLALPLGILALVAQGGIPRTWTGGGGDGNWFNAANWDPADNYPIEGDTAIISNDLVLLNASTESLQALFIGEGTLFFTNWTTTLTADTVTIASNGCLKPPPPS